MNAKTETPQTSDEEFLEQIQIATLALELETPPVRPNVFARARRWLSDRFRGRDEQP